jgi:hypothetical protein
MLPAPNLSWRSTPTAARLTAGYVLDPGSSPTSGPDRTTTAAGRGAVRAQCQALVCYCVPPGSAVSLAADPLLPYAQISARSVSVGSIGPSRSRLDKLRHHPAIAIVIDAEPARAAMSRPAAVMP